MKFTIIFVLLTFATIAAYLVVRNPASVNIRVMHRSNETATTGELHNVVAHESMRSVGDLLQRHEGRPGRQPASELPVEYEPDDFMAVTHGFRFSRFKEVVIGARTVASGEAGSGTSDIEGCSGVVGVCGLEILAVRVNQSVLTSTAASAPGG